MAEYLIQGETLTGIADKIRPLLGLTGAMTPEQMQTNLTTEQANITAALAALTEKGVEVPTGANSNALAGLIEAIEAGGATIEEGTWTPSETTSSFAGVSERLVETRIYPKYAFVGRVYESASSVAWTKNDGLGFAFSKLNSSDSSKIYVERFSFGGGSIYNEPRFIYNPNATSYGALIPSNPISLNFMLNNGAAMPYLAGVTYKWVAIW